MIPLKKVSNKDEKEEFDKAMWLYKKQKKYVYILVFLLFKSLFFCLIFNKDCYYVTQTNNFTFETPKGYQRALNTYCGISKLIVHLTDNNEQNLTIFTFKICLKIK